MHSHVGWLRGNRKRLAGAYGSRGRIRVIHGVTFPVSLCTIARGAVLTDIGRLLVTPLASIPTRQY